MRRNVRKLSWVLWLVIVAFIAFYIPDLIRGPSNIVARVDGEPIYIADFQQALQQQTAYYQSVSGGNLPDDFLQQMQIREIVLESLIRDRLILAAARDQGLSVSAREILARIMEYPTFQEDGIFIGPDRYKQVLQVNGISFEDFERQVHDEVLFEKFTELVSNGVTVTNREIEDAYQRANEQAQFDFFIVSSAGLEPEVSELLTDEGVRVLFEENIFDYRVPERRRVSFAVIETEAIRESVKLDEQELRTAYAASIEEFTIPEEVRARHILFRLPPEPDEETIAETSSAAQEILSEIRNGADFSTLAEENSDDTATATSGGDLGWFRRGRMTPEFEEVAFSLEIDETSDIVQTPFGLHIIRLDGSRPEQVRPFEEVRAQLDQRITFERSEEIADQRAEELRVEVLRRTNFEDLAAQFGLELRASPLFSQLEGFSEVLSPEFTRQVFVAGRDRVSEPIRFGNGHVIFRVDEIVESHEPELAEVEDAVRSDLIIELAEERAAEVADEFAARLEQGEGFDVLAAEIAASIQSTELIQRDGVVPDLGRQSALVLAAFDHAPGEVGGPVKVDRGYALFRVTAHVQPDWGQYATQGDVLRNEMLNQRRSGLFESLVRELREQYTVVTYEDVTASIIS
jgi:peptidyl-prolyl cis-trans isomerase D